MASPLAYVMEGGWAGLGSLLISMSTFCGTRASCQHIRGAPGLARWLRYGGRLGRIGQLAHC